MILAINHITLAVTDLEQSLPKEPNEELNQLLRQIVAFRIDINDIQAKFKLSQKQNSLERNNVIENLSKMNEARQEVAQLMREVIKLGVE